MITTGFQAFRQARAPVEGSNPRQRFLQISGRNRYLPCHLQPQKKKNKWRRRRKIEGRGARGTGSALTLTCGDSVRDHWTHQQTHTCTYTHIKHFVSDLHECKVPKIKGVLCNSTAA
ncbi:hypothetical protein PoB_006192400 [Plakobranchus ocellatus]|uniref:Uncharacterized protein n=1 Tax=Plakobranchus ocellatus TaxID=259542 RepID=A0AAV4CU44_9GAST|nr:hypothetical protein PoB_006192400 [Plakobranchus ocellatus]